MIPPSAPARLDGHDAITMLRVHRTMVRIRVFESRVQALFLAGQLPGFVHTYLGQEAIAAAVGAALRATDYLTSTHRGHGHAIAKGMQPDVVMAELFGKATGANQGRGGSMHVADFSLGMLGANGIVGGGVGIAAGAALAAQLRRTGQVVVCFFGDGATNKGTFHEGLNFAGLRRLPVVYVCENNQYAQFTSIERTSSVADLAQRAAGYGFDGISVDGNDAGAVLDAATAAVTRARDGGGPTLLNCITYRHGGHFVGDAEVYRDAAEVSAWKQADPIDRLERAVLAAGWAEPDALRSVWDEAAAEIDTAVSFAEASPYPDVSTALDFVYTDGARWPE
jgi:TPP-dependent pyruvate/acetoin dehydrogenase alpha subunit